MKKILVNVNIQFEYDDDMFSRNGQIDDDDVIRKVMYDIQEMVEDGDTSMMDIDITEEDFDDE